MNTIIGPSWVKVGFSNVGNIAQAQLGPAIYEKIVKYFFLDNF